MKREIPVSKNEHYKVEVHDIGSRGEGIGKIGDFTIFIEKALPGDIVEVRIVKVKSSFAYGKLIQIIEPSELRATPRCEVASSCGGCQLQHLHYDAQLEYKRKKVKDALIRIGKIEDVEVLPTIGMDTPYEYRNKAQFPVGSEDGKLSIGFYASRSHRIIDTQECGIQHKSNTDIVATVRRFLEEFHIPTYDEKTYQGLVRHIVTKVGFKTNEIMVCIVINGEKLPHSQELVDRLKTIDGVKSIVLNHNTTKGNVILGPTITTLYGNSYIRDYIGDIQFEISPLSFFQVNPVQTEVLYKKALEYADLTGNEVVWDAYCGIGTISLFLAQKAKMVYGVEIIEEAINDAKRNANLNGIKNVEFFTGAAEEIIPVKYEEDGIKADVIVVDPPRKGCDEKLLETIAKMEPKRIVYVSCDPGTLARDLGYLVQHGYKVIKVQPVDMFPQSVHVECVVLMCASS